MCVFKFPDRENFLPQIEHRKCLWPSCTVLVCVPRYPDCENVLAQMVHWKMVWLLCDVSLHFPGLWLLSVLSWCCFVLFCSGSVDDIIVSWCTVFDWREIYSATSLQFSFAPWMVLILSIKLVPLSSFFFLIWWPYGKPMLQMSSVNRKEASDNASGSEPLISCLFPLLFQLKYVLHVLFPRVTRYTGAKLSQQCETHVGPAIFWRRVKNMIWRVFVEYLWSSLSQIPSSSLIPFEVQLQCRVHWLSENAAQIPLLQMKQSTDMKTHTSVQNSDVYHLLIGLTACWKFSIDICGWFLLMRSTSFFEPPSTSTQINCGLWHKDFAHTRQSSLNHFCVAKELLACMYQHAGTHSDRPKSIEVNTSTCIFF